MASKADRGRNRSLTGVPGGIAAPQLPVPEAGVCRSGGESNSKRGSAVPELKQNLACKVRSVWL
ncbi:MAG: hypothetical protein JNJ49_11380 [Bdellovibrionaceae bacterium]|nr:hypothetical protein [Pseudobdellovibrionaceae bacterium]